MTFKILSATFLQDGKHSFTLDFTQPESNSQDCEFTLLIGKNGVSKSLILEAYHRFPPLCLGKLYHVFDG